MRHLPLCLLALALASISAPTKAVADDDDTMQKPQTLKRKISRTVTANYLLFLPQAYSAKDKKLWPMILFLHGAGERGTNVNQVKVHGPPKIVKNRPDFPFILVSPQCPDGETWSDDVLLALLEEVQSRHRVDPARVYLTGLSMGGYGTWSLGLRYPERFAAIAPICGGGDPIGVFLSSREKAAALKTLPVWAFHGAKDPVVKLEESERMINALKKTGAQEVELTVYPEASHDSWTATYNNPKLYDWFLKHQRQGPISDFRRSGR